MRFAAVRVKLVLSHDQNAVVVWAPLVGSREARSALGNRAVAHQFNRPEGPPFIPNPGAITRRNHVIKEMKIDEAIGAMQQVAGFARVLVGTKVGGSALRFRGGCDPSARHHFGNELHALAMIVARESVWNCLFEKIVRALGDTAAQLPGHRVMIDFSSGWIGSLLINTRFSKGQGVRIGSVPAAMLDVH